MITIKLRVNWFVFKCFSVRWLIFYNENVRTRAGQTIALEQIRITVSCDFFFLYRDRPRICQGRRKGRAGDWTEPLASERPRANRFLNGTLYFCFIHFYLFRFVYTNISHPPVRSAVHWAPLE